MPSNGLVKAVNL